MSLIDEKLTNNIKFDYGEDYYYFEYLKVKEAVLDFEQWCKEMMEKYPYQKLRYAMILEKHKKIFGDFEK